MCLTVYLLRVKQPVQKLYQCTYSNRIVYPIWRMHVKPCHSLNLTFIDLTIWLPVHFVGFLMCILEHWLLASLLEYALFIRRFWIKEAGRKDLWTNWLIWTILALFYDHCIDRWFFFLFRSTTKSRPNNITGGMSVRTSVRPPVHKKFLRFQWNLVYSEMSMSDARQYAVWPDPRSRSRSRAVEIWIPSIFKTYLLRHLQWELASEH